MNFVALYLLNFGNYAPLYFCKSAYKYAVRYYDLGVLDFCEGRVSNYAYQVLESKSAKRVLDDITRIRDHYDI